MAEYKDILAIAKQLENESVGSKKEKEDDLAGDFHQLLNVPFLSDQ
jgi:hypothetical protein